MAFVAKQKAQHTHKHTIPWQQKHATAAILVTEKDDAH